MEVRQACATDWEVLRELRLWALADAPDAFASTLDQEAAFPEQVWRQRAEGGEGSVNFIAFEGGSGMADTGAQVARSVTIAVDGSHALVVSTYCERNFHTLKFFFAE